MSVETDPRLCFVLMLTQDELIWHIMIMRADGCRLSGRRMDPPLDRRGR